MRIQALFVVASLAIVPASAEACAVNARSDTLWDLVRLADVIVVGDVVKDRNANPLFFSDLPKHRVITLRVRQVWKGEAPKTVDILVPIFPEPTHEKGQRVTAFLRTTTLGIHVLIPAERNVQSISLTDLTTLEPFVLEAVQLQLQNNPQLERRWLTRLSAHRTTRWDGLYELQSRSQSLTQEEIEAVAEGFIADARPDPSFPLLLAALSEYEDDRVDRAAMAVADMLLQREAGAPHYLSVAMPLLLERLGHPDPHRFFPDASYHSTQYLRESWETSLDELNLERVGNDRRLRARAASPALRKSQKRAMTTRASATWRR